jgi:hypothetical protein
MAAGMTEEPLPRGSRWTMAAFEVRPKHIIRINDVWVEIRDTCTEIGCGIAECRFRGREYFKGRAVELTVPMDWRFEAATEQEIIAGAFETERAALSRNDICRHWQEIAAKHPNMTVESFVNRLLLEIDDKKT